VAQRRGRPARREPPIPENSITKPPSAELRPGQLDTDSLPDYEVLDAILAGYVDGDLGRDELIAAGHDPALVDRVLRMVDLAEYKRRQSAPGHQDLHQGVRPGPPPADHQPVSRSLPERNS
jgi:NAD+ synthase (glutamine-hydrolysing)